MRVDQWCVCVPSVWAGTWIRLFLSRIRPIYICLKHTVRQGLLSYTAKGLWKTNVFRVYAQSSVLRVRVEGRRYLLECWPRQLVAFNMLLNLYEP